MQLNIQRRRSDRNFTLIARVRTHTVLLLFLLASRSFALDPSLDISQYAHTAWRVRDGFAKGFLYSIAQTPDGYLWLGTEFGLLRFDGVRAVPWQPPAGQQLPGMDIPKLLVTKDGALWIGTFNGLARWQNGRLTTVAELNGQRISSLLQDRDGAVWIGTKAGKLCTFQNDRIQCHGSSLSDVRSLYEDSRGNLLVGVPNGFWKWKPGPSESYSINDVMDGPSFGEDDRAAVLIGTQLGLLSLVDGRIEPYPLPGVSQPFRTSRILRDREGGLWIATLGRGLLHYRKGATDAFSEADGLSGDTVKDLLEDLQGNVWVVTPNGIDRFRDYAVPNFGIKQGLSNTDAVAALALKDGSVLIGTYNGLNRLKDGHISLLGQGTGAPKDGGISGRLTYSLFQDSSGRTWLSTLSQYGYLKSNRFVPVLDLRGGWAFSIAEVPAGHLWVAVDQNRGLFHLFQDKVVQNIPWDALEHKDHARVLLADAAQHGLWLGFAQGGVSYFSDGKIQKAYSASEGLSRGRVNGLRFGADGALWAATEGGLSRIKDGRVTTLTSKNGLPCDTVHWSLEDNAHSLWLYMSCGLAQIARSELDAWVADPGRSVKAKLFDASDGVRIHSYPTDADAVTKAPDGRIWFTAFDGLCVIDPRRLAFNKIPPPVIIEDITGDGKPYEVRSEMRLPPRVHDLTINYTALSLAAPEKTHFRFKLEGQDRDWREVVNKREVQYSNLAPGNYRFRLTACNNSGVWNTEGTSLKFVIPPAWYQTKTFRFLCAAAILALLWGTYQLRVRQLEEQEKRFREAVETMPALAFVARPDGYRTFVNRGWIEYSGMTVEEASGSGWQAAVHPDDLKKVADKWRTAAAKGDPLDYEVRLRRGADGEYRWFQTRAAPLRDKHGKLVKWCGVATDIEDRKRAEQLQADLAHMNRVSLLGELAASISHELKQPITGAMTNARAGVRWLKRDLPEVQEALSAIERIERDGARATEIIDRLRALYRKTPPKRQLIDANEIISEMVVMLRGEANRCGVSMRTDLAPVLPKVTADRVQLQQVLMNLMLNAIEAMKETGGVLTIRSQIDEQGPVLISVSDTGVGLPTDKADQIFNAFFTTKPQGSGMGLAISRSIVESHGGRLWATPNDGRGATFSFTLPYEMTAKA